MPRHPQKSDFTNTACWSHLFQVRISLLQQSTPLTKKQKGELWSPTNYIQIERVVRVVVTRWENPPPREEQSHDFINVILQINPPSSSRSSLYPLQCPLLIHHQLIHQITCHCRNIRGYRYGVNEVQMLNPCLLIFRASKRLQEMARTNERSLRMSGFTSGGTDLKQTSVYLGNGYGLYVSSSWSILGKR